MKIRLEFNGGPIDGFEGDLETEEGEAPTNEILRPVLGSAGVYGGAEITYPAGTWVYTLDAWPAEVAAYSFTGWRKVKMR